MRLVYSGNESRNDNAKITDSILWATEEWGKRDSNGWVRWHDMACKYNWATKWGSSNATRSRKGLVEMGLIEELFNLDQSGKPTAAHTGYFRIAR